MGYLNTFISVFNTGQPQWNNSMDSIAYMGKILIHISLLPLFVVLWISRGHSHSYIGPCGCNRLSCWLISTERLWKWGWYTVYYWCSLLMWLIKWLPVPFLGLGQARRAVPPLCFSHSYMRSVVAVRLGYLLLTTLLVCLTLNYGTYTDYNNFHARGR